MDDANPLSFTGRLKLIKTVLNSTLNCWIQSFKVPNAFMKDIERISARFLWKGRLHAWSWETTCRPRKEGGMGIRAVSDL